MKGVKLETMLRMMKDSEKKALEQKHVKELKIIEKDEEGNPIEMFSVFKMPLMSARESLIKCVIDKQDDGKVKFLVHSHERDDFPITDKMIRI